MKRIFLMALLAFVALVCAQAGNATNSISVSPIAGDAGSEIEVTVSLTNTDAVGALQVLLTLPAEADVTVNPEAVPAGRAAGFSAAAGIRDGKISVMLYSLDGKSIAAGNGEVVRFKVTPGEKPVEAEMAAEAIVTDAGGNRLTCSVEPVTLLCRRPMLEIVSGSVDFGRVPLNLTEQRTITLRNTGTSPLVVTGIKCERQEFEVVSALPLTVAAGNSATMELRFNPDERGLINVAAQIESNCSGVFNVVELSATPYAVNTLTVGTASGTSDSEVEIPLKVANMDAINGVTLELPLPGQLEYVDGSFMLDKNRATDHQFTANYSDGVLKVMIYSLTNSPLTGSDGSVASFKVKLQGKGTVTLRPSKAVLSAFYKDEVTDVLSDIYNGSVTITYPSISVGSGVSLGRTSVTEDATATFRIRNDGNAPLTVSRIAGETEYFEVLTALPLTVKNGAYADVTVACPSMVAGEYTDVLNIYSNDPDRRLVSVAIDAIRYYDNHLDFSAPVIVTDLQEAWIDVNLSNYSRVKGLQFDVRYPGAALAAADDAETSGRASDFQVIKRDIAAGVARYFVFSLSGSVIDPGEGDILRIPFTMLEGIVPGLQTITAENFTVSSEAMENLSSQLSGVNFTVNFAERGDINTDRVINALDTDMLSNHILDPSQSQLHINLTDFNFDGDVNSLDLDMLSNIILINK